VNRLNTNEQQHTWINSALLKQFTSTWRMLQKAIENVEPTRWAVTEKDWSFAKTAYHILETQEFYIRDSPEGMVWNKMLKTIKEKGKEKTILPTKEQLLTYLEEIEGKVTSYLKELTFEQLAMQDGFKWFNSILEKLLYLLRHNAHHLGELGRMLREWDNKRMKWQ